MRIVNAPLSGSPDDAERRAFAERLRRRQVPENEVPGLAAGPQLLGRTDDVALHLRAAVVELWPREDEPEWQPPPRPRRPPAPEGGWFADA